MWIIQTLSLFAVVTAIVGNHPIENWCVVEMATNQLVKPDTTELL